MQARSQSVADYLRVRRPVAAMAKDFAAGHTIPEDTHTRGQLVHAVADVMTVAGMPVLQVALDPGCASPSAFAAMFRKTIGTAPREYFSPLSRSSTQQPGKT